MIRGRPGFAWKSKLKQQKIRDGECQLVWSAILDYESANNPYPERRKAIGAWRKLAALHVRISDATLVVARNLLSLGLGEYDALHVACAIQSAADLFVSTDDRLIRKLRGHHDILALLPGDALAHLENWYEN